MIRSLLQNARPTQLDFSVVICLYNKVAFIRAAVLSALEQSYAPHEIIVVDDGSQDDGVAQAASIGDPRIRIVRQDNAGPGPARNRGVMEARSQWVSFLDADDLWHRDHLAIHARAIAAYPDAGAMATALRRAPDGPFTWDKIDVSSVDAGPVDYIAEMANIIGARIKDGEILSSSTTSIQREAFTRTDGFGDEWPGEDTEFWARFSLEHQIITSRALTVRYRTNTGGLMDSANLKHWTVEQIQKHPLRRRLVRALEDPRHVDRAPALRAYLTAIDANAMRGALYNECSKDAHHLAKALGPEAVAKLGRERWLLNLPPTVSDRLVNIFKTAMRWQRADRSEKRA